MAATTLVFNEGMMQLSSGGSVNWMVDTIKARAVLSSVTPNRDDTSLTGMTAVGVDSILSGKTKAKDTVTDRVTFSAANPTIINAVGNIGCIVVYKFVSTDANSIPLFCIALTYTSNGDFVARFFNGVVGITQQ